MDSHNIWTAEEEKILKDIYPTLFPQEVEKVLSLFLPNRSFHSCENKIHRLGIEKKGRKPRSIKSFELESDGWYVSGLTDGEGCFRASIRHQWKGNPSARVEFLLSLRSDDNEVLEWLQRYFDCGNLVLLQGRKCGNGNVSKPQLQFSVSSLYDIHRSIIPHFDKFKLRAKKRKDYVIWRELACLLADTYDSVLTDHNLYQAEELNRQLKDIRIFKE